MTLLFNRYLELRVFMKSLLVFNIRELHMEFVIELHRDETPNIARIYIYNLSEKTRSMISEDHQGIEFYGGYNSEGLPILPPGLTPQLFKGSTINVTHYQADNKVDWVTEILAGDGNKEFLESYFKKSYVKGTPISKLFVDLALVFGLPFTTDFIDPTAIMARSQSYSGKVKDILKDVCDDYLLSWSFQNQTLEIVNANNPPLKDLAVTVFTSDTGLIDRPILVERPAAQKKKKCNKGAPKVPPPPPRVGVQLNSLLDGKMKPGRLFKVFPVLPLSSLGVETLKRKGELKIPSASSIYIADKVRHIGSNFLKDFTTQVDGDVYAL